MSIIVLKKIIENITSGKEDNKQYILKGIFIANIICYTLLLINLKYNLYLLDYT